jgi:serine/threonine-protein kinase
MRFIAFPLSAQKEFAEIPTSNRSTGAIEAYYYRGMGGDDSQPDSMFSYVSPDSLGAILFEMLTGRPPFSGATLAELIHAVVHGPPPVLAGSAAVCAFDRVVRRALAKAPSDRYRDIASFADQGLTPSQRASN